MRCRDATVLKENDTSISTSTGPEFPEAFLKDMERNFGSERRSTYRPTHRTAYAVEDTGSDEEGKLKICWLDYASEYAKGLGIAERSITQMKSLPFRFVRFEPAPPYRIISKDSFTF
jgi:hypothetical protein